MRTPASALLFLTGLAALSATLSASTASAQFVHPRRARAMSLMGAPRTAVLVASDRAWVPSDGREAPLSVCVGDRCRPVRAIEACDPPSCPGYGQVAILTESVADVGGYPTDRGGFEREREAMFGDPEIAAIAPYLTSHPQPPPGPLRWYRGEDRRTARFEASLAVGAAYLAHADVPSGDLTIGAGVRFPIDWGNDDDDDFLGIMIGSELGADLRVHVIPNLHGRIFDDFAVAVGFATHFRMIPADEALRLPSAIGVLIPEVGVIAQGQGDPVFYAQWNADVGLLLDPDAALEARASVMIVDDWVEGDDVEAILGLSLALVLR